MQQLRTLLFAFVLFALSSVDAADPPGAKRVPRPSFTAAERDVFFDDARELLVGPRPALNATATNVAAAAGATAPAVVTGGDGGYAWSSLIAAETIESEIKRNATQLAPLVQTASAFKGGGYRDARDIFSTLAVMFATAAQYDKEVRWKDSAAGLAALYSRAGFNCKVGTDQSFREAQLREQDLAELIRGGRPEVPEASEEFAWDRMADRSPLMKRMELALDKRLTPEVGDARSMKGKADDLVHEAQILALLAEVIVQPGAADADDDTYQGYSHELREAAVDFGRSVEADNFDGARDALGRMQKSCTTCHGDYRG